MDRLVHLLTQACHHFDQICREPVFPPFGVRLPTAVVQSGDGRYASFPFPAVFSSDSRNALLDFVLEDVPGQGATQFALMGHVKVRVGMEEKTHEEKNIPIAVGTVLRVPSGDITIRSISSEDSTITNSPRVIMQLVSKTAIDQIKQIEFFDEDGSPVRATLQRPYTVNAAPDYRPAEWTLQCHLSNDIQKGSVKVTYFNRVEQSTIPIKLIGCVGM